ncbi:MAG: methyl-accepting chemotaxis protein [Acidobacteriaceae bacterium]|nr:methyl-accepting chemotaxis protein [Acidobacteriaceae bacterium]
MASATRIPNLTGTTPVKVRTKVTTMPPASSKHSDSDAALAAIGRSQGIVEFNLDGTILTANTLFLNLVGYSQDEVSGRHHSMFVDPTEASGAEYRNFWESIRRGETRTGIFRRLGKNGKEIWLQGCYMPVLDAAGQPYKAVKIALDITTDMQRNVAYRGQVDAVSRTQAVIEFKLDGTIVNANENFLAAMGYSMDEIKGNHHRIFMDKSEASTSDYRAFWDALARGEYQHGEYKRIGKGGREVWIYGSYNPIFGASGKPERVVKFATEITETVRTRQEHQAAQEATRQRALELEAKVNAILSVVKRASEGDLTGRIDVHGSDSIGQMGEALASFFNDLRQRVTAIASSATDLSSASQELSVISEQMASNAEETATQASVVSSASDEVSKNVTVVAAGSEEMQASIREISKSANESARVAHSAVTAATATNQTIAKLGQSSLEIGKVVKVITSIAQQTNLLALNATIEAARAGEAGKGFAVVANEVKELAKETAKATEEIGQKIEAIQTDTTSAVQAIEEITQIINQINDVSNTIASAVEEQTATTNEIGRSVSDASRGVSEIAVNIAGVATAAQGTTNGAAGTQTSARTLYSMASELQNLVSRFTV